MILPDEMSRDELLHKMYPYKGTFSKKYTKEYYQQKFYTDRRFLKEALESYEQEKKSDAMRLMKQLISPLH